ncbi:MAG: ferritin-like protein [Actinomycetota bacterium]|nr:ferritin-like protein [Actinomycetota bacterium]
MDTEPVIVIENRKELTYLLCQAAEIEHGLMCEYLYAAFSLKRAPGPGLDEAQLPAVERWRSVLLSVATEEMLHWALINNLLTAVGSAPHVSRPNLPHRGAGYPADVQLALLPFGERALRHFVFLERPEGTQLDDAEGFEPIGAALPPMAPTEVLPRGQEFATVGHLYRSLEAGLAHLADKYGESRLFIGPPRAQATRSTFGWPDLVPIGDLPSAIAAIERIVEQGEGARGDSSSAHYGRFVAVLDEYLAVRAADAGFDPAHPVTAAGVRPVEGVESEVRITDPVTAAVSDLFDLVYDLVLQVLVRYFAFGHETDEQLHVLADSAVGLMLRAIEPLGMLLATLPVGPEHPGATAGANFQLAYRSNFLLPHRRAAWIRFCERLEEAADFSEAIGGPPDARRLLAAVAEELRGLSARMSTHVEPLPG